MNYISSRMQAYALHLFAIEIQVSKDYYQGIIETFYLREQKSKQLIVLDSHQEYADETYCYYHVKYPLDITQVYDILDMYGLTVVLQYQKLIAMPSFDTQFYYDCNDLGATYQKDQTTWKVWTPTALQVSLVVHQKDKRCSYSMSKNQSGVFSITLVGDYDGTIYTYLVNHGASYIETLDPYSYGSISNAKGSVVINLERCLMDLNKADLPIMSKKSDAIIYELSIRDFTSDTTVLNPFPGKYMGLTKVGLKTKQGNLMGLDYVSMLGITHVQLMPMYDFATVEENHPNTFYNWGYDPMQYNVPEGSYSTNPDDPYARIVECQEMIAAFHTQGLRVVMDVVYNHMYDTKQAAFENLVPGYFFRRDSHGNLSNGSWCGNDIQTEAAMVRKYIVDMCDRWVQLYGVDGLRFDLMGLVDTKTLQTIYQSCYQQDKSFIMYGEGWNMDTTLAVEHRGMQDNHAKIPMVGFFNDVFRDKLKGLSDDMNLHDKGYFSGNMYNTESLCQCLKNTSRYSSVVQSINYVECHDNATIYDKYSLSNAEESDDLRRKRQKLLTMTTILAQGIPFIHSGQEWYRTKQGITNSYCTADEINKVNWSMTDTYQKDIQEIMKIIQIRKEYADYWYDTIEEVETNIQVKSFEHQVVHYVLNKKEKSAALWIYINGSNQKYQVELPENYEILYNPTNSKEIVEINPVSMVILKLR